MAVCDPPLINTHTNNIYIYKAGTIFIKTPKFGNKSFFDVFSIISRFILFTISIIYGYFRFCSFSKRDNKILKWKSES